MLGALLGVLARFTAAQVALGVATVSVLTVAVAGSAEVVTAVAVSRAVAAGEAEAPPRRSPLAVLASPIDVEPEWQVERVRYTLADIPTSIAAISFLVVAPVVPPSEIVIQAVHPEGASYRCSLVSTGADVAVTCPTVKPELPVAEANRLSIAVRGEARS